MVWILIGLGVLFILTNFGPVFLPVLLLLLIFWLIIRFIVMPAEPTIPPRPRSNLPALRAKLAAIDAFSRTVSSTAHSSALSTQERQHAVYLLLEQARTELRGLGQLTPEVDRHLCQLADKAVAGYTNQLASFGAGLTAIIDAYKPPTRRKAKRV